MSEEKDQIKEIKIKEKVMEKIKSGRVKLRSKYVFLAEKLGLSSAFVLSFLLAALFFCLFLYYFKASDNLAYLSLGSRGFFVFLESFPYLLVVGLIIFIFIAGYLVKKSEWAYKRVIGHWALVLAGLVIIIGAVLAYANMGEIIEREAFGRRPMGMFFRPFLQSGLNERQFGAAGRVIEIKNNSVTIQTPQGIKTVDLEKIDIPFKGSLKEGMFIIAVGENKNSFFEARGIKIMPGEGDLPMIRRGVDRRHGAFERKVLPLPPPEFGRMENFGGDKIIELKEGLPLPPLNFNGGRPGQWNGVCNQ